MIVNMYITMLPVILGGVINMIFTKTPFYRKYKYPIDGYRNWKDKKRIFGDNKTWIGLLSMSIACMLVQVIWGQLCDAIGIVGRNELYRVHENTVLFNMYVGFLFGLVYMLMELPNSFIKRRLSISPGMTEHGIKGRIFFVIDQIDSLIGVMLVLACFTPMSIWKYWGYIILGGFTHISVNFVLYQLKIRRNL